MHLMTVTEHSRHGTVMLRPGKHMIEDVNAAEFLKLEAGYLTYEPVTEMLIQPDDDLNGKRIVIVRPGGLGDLLFLTPSLREIKRRWPDSIVHVACFDQFACVLGNNLDVDMAGGYPLRVEHWQTANRKVWLENMLEKGYEARSVPAIDLFAQRIGLTGLVDKRLRYHTMAEEFQDAWRRFPKTGKKRIGYQPYSSAQSRTYPEKQSIKVVELLQKRGHEVVIFGSPRDVKSQPGRDFIDLTAQDPVMTFRESAAVLTTCDGFIGPDSSWLHMASALSVPAVGLFASIPWHLRTGYAEKTYALTGKCVMSPCHHHTRKGLIFPEDGPCNEAGHCTALAEIQPERIVAKLEGLI